MHIFDINKVKVQLVPKCRAVTTFINHLNDHHSEKQGLSWPSDLMTVTPGLIFRTKTKEAADDTLCLGKETLTVIRGVLFCEGQEI